MITRNRLLLPLSALLVAALVAALTWAVSSRPTHSRAVLRLVGSGGVARDAAVPAQGTYSPSTPSSQPYRLTGELPSDQPADAPVYALEGPFDTSRLRHALPDGTVTTEHAAWWWSPSCGMGLVGSGAPDEKPSGAPNEKPSAPPADSTPDAVPPPSADEPVSSCATAGSGSSSPAVVSSGVDPTPQPDVVAPTQPSMTEEQARAAAKPAFEAVGLSVADANVHVTPYGASVLLDPVVNGLRTSGYTTRVELGPGREITWASGFLGDLAKGDSYPLITAKQAFDALPVPPQMEMMCPVGPDGKGCVATPPQEITGAVLGLQLRQTASGSQLLVPAWLFDVKGSDDRLGQVAVSDKYLGEPDATDKASQPSSVQPSGPTGVEPAGPPSAVPPSKG